jgi:hypothetical protein
MLLLVENYIPARCPFRGLKRWKLLGAVSGGLCARWSSGPELATYAMCLTPSGFHLFGLLKGHPADKQFSTNSNMSFPG